METNEPSSGKRAESRKRPGHLREGFFIQEEEEETNRNPW